MRKTYPSDITREQFEKIKPILEGVKKKTSPRKVDLYDVFCAVLYILKTGCQWTALPHDFPKRSNVHRYFSIWNKKKKKQSSILDEILKKISWRGSYVQWSDRENKFLHH